MFGLRDSHMWNGLWKYIVVLCNSNGILLLELCEELAIHRQYHIPTEKQVQDNMDAPGFKTIEPTRLSTFEATKHSRYALCSCYEGC